MSIKGDRFGRWISSMTTIPSDTVPTVVSMLRSRDSQCYSRKEGVDYGSGDIRANMTHGMDCVHEMWSHSRARPGG